ncbi:MAG TPA: hypothetical protein VFO21_22475 [Vicinamibacterales bacterium]|nr:hypothetical protein [Vicinamibacterales bacterium]
MSRGDQLDARIRGDAPLRVLRQWRIEIKQTTLDQLHDTVGEDRLGVGTRGEHRVAVHRLVRPGVLDSKRAPPGETAVADDGD